MDRRAWIAALSLSFLGACNWVDGACWLKSEDGAGSGVGGGPIAPVGGGFGDAPDSTPQAAGDPPPPPECLQVPQGACNQKCLSDYETAAAKCGEIESESQRTICQSSAYTAYKTCRSTCQQQQNDCLDHCKDLCVDIWEGCYDKCGKSDNVCKEKCMRQLIACNEKCEEKCK